MHNVSTHARARRATKSHMRLAPRTGFNSRPRAAGDEKMSRSARGPLFQLTPARGGRLRRCNDGQPVHVSTHARARRATDQRFRGKRLLSFNSRPRAAGDRERQAISEANVFQLTPARGGRRVLGPKSLCRPCFNSRPRAAGDGPVVLDSRGRSVSTHARARRATWAGRQSARSWWFQLTPARGGRPGWRHHTQ